MVVKSYHRLAKLNSNSNNDKHNNDVTKLRKALNKINDCFKGKNRKDELKDTG